MIASTASLTCIFNIAHVPHAPVSPAPGNDLGRTSTKLLSTAATFSSSAWLLNATCVCQRVSAHQASSTVKHLPAVYDYSVDVPLMMSDSSTKPSLERDKHLMLAGCFLLERSGV
jgi:hypothetical protein